MTSGEKGGGTTSPPWKPKDNNERAAVVALCVQTVAQYHSYATGMYDAAERIVPPVPTPEPELNTHKGVTYRDGKWWVSDTGAYGTAHSLITYAALLNLTDDDHAALMELKANPVKVATTPATVAGEPVGYMNVYHEDGDKTFHGSLHSARKDSDYSVAETAVPLYRHPATIDDAIALLVREGWRLRNDMSVYEKGVTVVGKNVRVLIAPTPEVK